MLSPAYVQAIERAFLEMSGKGLMLSARDLELIQRWARAGLPAKIVIQGIERAFDHRKQARRTIRGLESVVKSVETVAQEWRARQVGARSEVSSPGSIDPPRASSGQSQPTSGVAAQGLARPLNADPVSQQQIGPHQALAQEQAELIQAFDRLLHSVETARADLPERSLAGLIDLLMGRLTQIRDDALIGRVEDPVTALEALEDKASHAFWDRLDAETQDMLSTRVDQMLASERRLASPQTWQATRDRQLMRQVRRHLGLPDLQLKLISASW